MFLTEIEAVDENLVKISEIFCDYVQPFNMINASDIPHLEKTCDNQRRKNVVSNFKSKEVHPIVAAENHPVV